ncbi:MAG: carboxypeptidase-like regulatory domain-containing protein, partial [Campylobacterales bacterium]|nr:carboxypeptidase-like regulatory domain-containing protein [Campylobacterales bacterium]
SFLQQEPTTVSGAKITLTGKKQKEFKYITKTDNNGYFSIEGIRLGEYRIKIKKGNLSFFGDVTISGSNQQKRFYLAEEDSPKFHIKENYLPINTLETLDQKIPLEIANGSSTDKKVCLSLFFDKDKVKDHRLENRCLTIQSRQTEIFQLEILFNKNINSQKNFNMGIGIESEGFIFREVVQLGVNYQYNPLRFNGKNSVKVYILSSDGKITQLNRRKEIGFVEQIDEVYTLVLYSKRKLDRYEVDIGYDINISNKLSIRKRSTLPFSLKKSLESDFGYLKEYKFRSMESVFLNEDDGTYQKALNDNTIISSKLYDETLATISLKDGLLTISPRKNKSGSSVISFFAIDDEGKYKIKKELYLNILERNDKPVIMFEPKKEVKEG